MRARDHGIAIGHGTRGPENAITDVAGVRVGHRTLIEGRGLLVVGRGPARTGVTVILPPGNVWDQPVFAGPHRLNGNGEMHQCTRLAQRAGLGVARVGGIGEHVRGPSAG